MDSPKLESSAPVYDAVCLNSIRGVSAVFAGKWTFLILEENGVVRREVRPTVPVTVEYSLTDKGRDFDSVLLAMKTWGEKWLDRES